MTTQTKDINMISGGVRSYVNVSQYDVGSEIKFALYNNSSAFTPPAGTTVRVEGRKPDGNGFSYSASLSDNVVTITVTDQMTVLSGEVLCELRLTKDSVDIGTANFILAVEEAPINSNVPISNTEIPAIIELARQEQYNAEAWAQGTRNGVPVSSDDPTYHNNAKYYGQELANSKADITAIGTDESGRTTASKAYAIGEHFYKDGKFCTAKTAIASGATFTLNTNYVEDDLSNTLKNKADSILTVTQNDSYEIIDNHIYMKNGMTIVSVLVKVISPSASNHVEIARIPSGYDTPIISIQSTSVSFDGGFSNAPLNFVLGTDRRLIVRGGIANCRYPVYITY